MLDLRNETGVPALPAKPHRYWIYLKVSPADREDAWDLCQVMMNYGRVEVSDCRFAFASDEQWRMTAEALCFRFGVKYFEAFASP